MVNHLISCHRVIAKVYADLGITEDNIPITDMMEWCAEAVEKIGAFEFYNIKITGKDGLELTSINNYQANLPKDCHSVIQVAYADNKYSKQFYPMKYATGSFSTRHQLTSEIEDTYNTDNDVPTYVKGTDDLVRLTMELYDITYDEALEKLNTEEELKSLLNNLLREDKFPNTTTSGGTVNPYQLEYKIVPGYIKTNAKNGYLMIAYRAIPTDKYGYPMIPDDPSFIEAAYWYIVTKLTYIDWRMGRVRDAVYYDAKSSWNFYVKQAYNKSLSFKSLDEIESFKDTWLRLVPPVNAGNSFYQYLNQQEHIRHT